METDEHHAGRFSGIRDKQINEGGSDYTVGADGSFVDVRPGSYETTEDVADDFDDIAEATDSAEDAWHKAND